MVSSTRLAPNAVDFGDGLSHGEIERQERARFGDAIVHLQSAPVASRRGQFLDFQRRVGDTPRADSKRRAAKLVCDIRR